MSNPFAPKQPQPVTSIELPNLVIEIEHNTKTVFIYAENPEANEVTFAPLAEHFKRQGYHLFITTPIVR